MRRFRARRRDERGAVATFGVLILFVLLMMGALVVDIGLQRVARADMQSLADIVALDVARELDGRKASVIEPLVDGIVDQAIDNNPDVIGWDSSRPTVTASLGTLDDQGTFVPLASSQAVPTAVRVVASTSVAFAFAGVTGVEEGDAARPSVAEASNSVCYRLGSFLAALDSDNPESVLAQLNELLGVNLDLVSYRALADAKVRLADLAAAPTIGSPTALLTGTITYQNLLKAVIHVLEKDKPKNSVAISALDALVAASAALPPLRLGDVIHVQPDDAAALEVALNVLDIVGSAKLATGEHFVEVPKLQSGVAGVGFQFGGSLALISAAQLACGLPNTPESVADNAQLEGTVAVEFTNLPSLNVPDVGTLQTPKGNGTIVVDIASGTGQLVAPPDVVCGRGTADKPHTFTVEVATDPASYRVNADVSVDGDVKVDALEKLGLGPLLTDLLGISLGNKVSVSVGVTLSVGSTEQADTQYADLSLPPNDVDPVSTGSEVRLDLATLIPTFHDLKIGGVDAPVADAGPLTSRILTALTDSGNDFLSKTLAPLVAHVDSMLVGPVAEMVGLRFAGADVYAVDVICGLPRLRE